MPTYNAPARTGTYGVISVVLGIAGLALFWYAPFGVVVALAGFLFGVVGWVRSSNAGVAPAWAIAGTLFCLAVLALDLAIATLGDTAWQMTAYH